MRQKNSPLKVIFFGLGSIGQRHLRLLQQTASAKLVIYAFRSGKSKNLSPKGTIELRSWKDVQELQPDIAFICNPSSLHTKTALKCVAAGLKHLFIEKPIDASADGLSPLLREVKNGKVTAYIAYPLRFHPAVLKTKELLAKTKHAKHARCVVSSYLPLWRPGINHKKQYSAQAKMGGGVILDLSHEFDLLQYLFGPCENMSGVAGRLTKVTVDAEDFADCLFMAGTTKVNLHMNFCSLENSRYIEINGHDFFIRLDILNNTVTYRTGKKEKNFSYTMSRDELFTKQLKFYLANLHNPKLMNNLLEASPLFKQILQFKRNCGRI